MVIEDEYVVRLSHKLENFKKQKRGLYNFRCPYCGDSKKKNKARGYLFQSKNAYIYKCHNCGIGKSFSNFVKDQDPQLHGQFLLEKFKDGAVMGKGSVTQRLPKPDFKFESPTFKNKVSLEKISDLNTSHPAREYLESRKISCLNRFYYCPKFKKWTNSLKPYAFADLKGDSDRIIIPFKDSHGKMFGFQGRSLSSRAKMRYITIMLDDRTKIFGLDHLNPSEAVYIVEGPFDATFLKNSVAMAGSDIDPRTYNWGNYIWVYDNEPRNRIIVDKISRSIGRGDKVVIWPKNIRQKDINDMFLAGHDVQNVVQSNVYQGLEANLKLNDWKKV